ELVGSASVALLAVPRTDLLAHVAPEDPVLERRAERARGVAPMLDRQVRDAATGVHGVAGTERAGRTRGMAARARAAVVFRQRNGVEDEVGEQLREEEVRAEGAMEDERIA